MASIEPKNKDDKIRVYVKFSLLEETRKKHPEVAHLTHTGLVEWALRKISSAKED
jgi:hypothetical protein